MKYLVLRAFKSYGVWYHKGDIVEAEKIRSPRLRQAEGKIIVADEVPIKSAVPSSPSSEDAAGANVLAADSELTGTMDPSDVTDMTDETEDDASEDTEASDVTDMTDETEDDASSETEEDKIIDGEESPKVPLLVFPAKE